MFRSLRLKPIYSSYENNLVEEFYNPILKKAVRFDRISAYFSAKSLALYSSGLENFVENGYKYRLIISKDISEEDYKFIKEGYKLKNKLTDDMVNSLNEDLSLEEEKNISNLAYLISIGVVDIKIAFVRKGIFHDKCGLFYDKNGNVICFRGSNNETVSAIANNYEAFTVTCSWLLDSNGFYKEIISKSEYEFDRLWNNEHKKIVVLGAEEVVMNEILKHNKNEIIIENTLLEENCVVLDYNERLLLRINTDDNNWIIKSTFYKLKLKRYIKYIDNNTVYFKDELSYLDFNKIDNLLCKKAKSLGKRYFVTNRFKNYIESRNLYIKKREQLGIAIKQHNEEKNEKIKETFYEYSEIVNNQMTRQLREQQMSDSFFMYTMKKSGNFSVPGSGKTSSVLGVYAFLKYKGLVKRIVMIGPKNSFESWIYEFNICFNGKEMLNIFNIQDAKYKNLSEKRKAIEYDTGGCNLLLFNYESLENLKDEIQYIIDENTLLVFDEVHKVKRVDGETPGIRASNALEVSKNSIYTIVLTGTPIPNSYLDLYNMLHILYRDEYNDFFGFSPRMLKNLSESEFDEVNRKIQPFFCRTTKKQLNVPEANEDEILLVNAPNKEKELFSIIYEKYKKNKLALFIRLLQLESNPKMLLRSIDFEEFRYILEDNYDIDKIDYIDYSDSVKSIIDSIELTSKKKSCINLIEKLVLEGKKVITWCIFIDSIKSIESHLNKLGLRVKCIYGETDVDERSKIIRDFKSGKFDVLITNPHTLAESVSLHSVCHDAVYFEYSYNLVHLLQSKDRIHRLGLPDGQYTQYYYMQSIFKIGENDFSIDSKIYERLVDKEKIMLDAIDNNKLEKVTTNAEDLEFILEKLFR